MVNIQVYEKDSNKKIETVRCEENETVRTLQKLGCECGTQAERIEKDTSKKTTMIRYYLSTKTHRIIVSMTIAQAERVNDYLASYEAFAEVFNETEDNETETGDENMTEKTGYDREIVLLENGEFKCDGRTFTYEGEPITVGDVLDTTRVGFDVVGSDYKGRFLLLSTGHILCRCSHYSRELNHTITYDEIVYAPTFSEIYATASDFIESRIELLETYQPTKEFKENVDYCSYKGRFFKDLVTMSAEELEAIDNSSAEFSTDDVQAYIDFLFAQAQDPKTWAKGVTIDADHIDYHIRNRIGWGIDYCEKYCSPSLEFFRLADKLYQESKVDRITSQDESEDVADETIIEFECVHGSASFKGYAYYSELDDDEPLHFYDRNCGSQTSLQNAHFEGSEDDVFALKDAFCSDFLFTQYLSDYADKSATIRREGYVLHINGGEQDIEESFGAGDDNGCDGMVGLSEVCNKIRSLGATETTIALNPIHNEDGSSDAKIYYYDGGDNEMFNECFDVNVKTIGELEYLKENLPNVVSDCATTFWDNPSLLFCNGFVIQDKEFQMVDGLILFCKIEGKKLYYRTYESGDWNEIKEESLEELKVEASKHPLGKWRYTGLGGTLGKMLYALTYYSTDIKMAVMSGYDSFYCEGTSLTGDTFQLRY